MDDVVKVISPFGEISAIAYVYPAIRPDVVAVPMGEGHIEFGRFAKDRGTNVTAILAPVTTPDGELAWGATRVRIEKLGRTRTLPRIENKYGRRRSQRRRRVSGLSKDPLLRTLHGGVRYE